MAQIKRHIETAQCELFNAVIDPIVFGFFGAQKFASRRRVKKQIAHFDAGSLRMRGRGDFYLHVTPFRNRSPGITVAAIGGETESRYRGYAGQRFTAKPQCGDGFEVFQIVDLAGGMTTQRQSQIVFADTATIISNTD